MPSENEIRKKIYDEIYSISQPGDICFFITEDMDLYKQRSAYEKLSRRWMGIAKNDISIWHMGILSKFKKIPGMPKCGHILFIQPKKMVSLNSISHQVTSPQRTLQIKIISARQ